jgi:drug/metabolite transporter (DMT)-like permease
MFTGAKYCSGYTIAAFTGLIPISALILSLIILKETVGFHQIIGCVLIAISIIIMSRREKHHFQNQAAGK